MIDIGGAGLERNVGEFAQRNVRVDASRSLIANLDVTDRFDVLSILGWQPNLNIP